MPTKPKSKSSFSNRSRDSLASKAYNMLAAQLLDHRLVPGMLLNRREIANQFDMSVAPVLEAMVQLESEGFLESVPRKGTLVSSVRLEDLRGHLILREALECEAARYYCGEPIVRAEDELIKLAETIDSMDSQARTEQWHAEFEFHFALVKLADVSAIEATFKKIMQKKLFMALNLYMSAHGVNNPRDSHVQLISKLKTSDPDEAERIIRTHLRGDKEELYRR
ncbi:GntR family transcriptional regulator [Cerasicoccus maritimus]|uniref:GntR family transcriptional regulator n=1 Tax=Cerasicoccus maritimus TaxID=490089 RepID=UPI0028524B18|nr:GntR family transcriptional regulator [Cerasicoccus maritimus]